jgi:diguanylate cyclase (GGDEF)-like protein
MFLLVLCSTVRRNHRDMMQLTLTERENARLLRRFRYLAQHDSLTSLANRAQLLEQLKFAFTRLTRATSADESLAVLYMDLDGFKAVNDTMGHTVGDGLLCAVADRLREVAREGDVVARLGGDEFAIVYRRTSREDAEALAAQLVEVVGRPYPLGAGRLVHVGVSIGLALAPEHAQDPDILLQRADLALYAAKTSSRKGTFRVFDAEMERQAIERRVLETELREALTENKGLLLHFQPIVNVNTGRVTTREALVRWHHAQRGMIAPADFVPLAEENGLILRLGEWVLRRACEAAMGWRDQSRVAVNVSAVQLDQDRSLPDLVRRSLQDTGLPPWRLELEVTETAMLRDSQQVMDQLQALRAIGVQITLDDFGAGYSSLAYLRNFTFDRIKIDGSFIRDAAGKPNCAAIVHAIADLGARLGADTVAEGIETEEQLALARAEGCTEVQGFLIGGPVIDPVAEPLCDTGLFTGLTIEDFPEFDFIWDTAPQAGRGDPLRGLTRAATDIIVTE